jgi:hypothetical protein
MRHLLAVGLAAVLPAAVAAQGTLGGQGFGYPVTAQSARAAGMGGSIAPFDELTPLNPAALGRTTAGAMFFHSEPESRRTTLGEARDNTSVVRFPLAGLIAPVKGRFAVGVTFGTLLDRTVETRSTVREAIGEELVDVTARFASSGAINDVRFAGAWRVSDALRVGGALHLITGENRLEIGRDFPDSVPLADVSSSALYGYTGRAASLGVDWTAGRHVSLAAHARLGGRLESSLGDTIVGRASVPLQLGAGLRYDGITATVLAASWQRTRWTDLAGLGSSTLAIRDADELSLGAESRGPPIFGTPLILRVGARQRTLPFDVLGARSSERSVGGGAGYTVSEGRASLNVAAQRFARRAGAARESGWLVSFGLAITP